MSWPQPTPELRPLSQPPSQSKMCILRYNHCGCQGCAEKLAKFQNRVEQIYKIPTPSLDEKKKTITVIGTSDAAGLRKLLKEATGKKHIEVLSNPLPPPPQALALALALAQAHAQAQAPQEAMSMREVEDAGIGRSTGGSMYYVRGSGGMGQMEQRGQYYSRDHENEKSVWNMANEESPSGCTIM